MSYIQNNSASSYSNAAQAYFNLLGSTPSDAYRVDQFFRALTAAGLDTYLVDGLLFRTTQNKTDGTLKSIRGASVTLTASPTLGAAGMILNGSSQYAYFDVTDTTASSVAFSWKGAITGQTSSGCQFSLQNTLGIGTGAASGTGGYDCQFNGTGAAYVFTGVNSTVAVTSAITDPVSSSACTVHYNNPYEQHVIVTNDNAASPALTAYVDGRLALNDSSGNVQTTVTRTRLVIGARVYNATGGNAQNFCKGTFTNIFLFNKVLNSTEAAAFDSAMRWLNPATKNIVFIGDSTSAWLSTKPSDSWSYQFSQQRDQVDARIYCTAINGQTADYFNTNYTAIISRFKPKQNGVDTSFAYVWLGINDINGGANNSTTYTRLQTMWAALRRDGFCVMANTLMPGTGYNVTMEGYRTALNTSIAADQSLFDSLFYPNLLFPDPNDSTFYLDTFHLKTLGNTVMANAVGMSAKPVVLLPRAYPLTDAATIATDASLIPDGGVAYVTLAGNRTLGNPTNPISGQRIVYRFLQDATGNRTITLDSKFTVGSWTVTLTTTASKADYLEVIYNLAADKWEVINFQKGY